MSSRLLTRAFWIVCFAFLCALPAFGDEHATISNALDHDAVHPGQRAVAAVIFDIKPGYHSQSHTPSQKNFIKFDVKTKESAGVTIYPPIFPPGADENYPTLGKLNIYTGRVIVYVPIEIKPDAPPGALELNGTVRFQICDDQSCFMPRTEAFTFKVNVVPPGQATAQANSEIFAGFDPATFPTKPPTTTAAEPDEAVENAAPSLPAEAQTSVWVAFYTAFFAGMLFNVMPCVLPVLPLKAMGFYEVSQHRRSSSVLLGLVFSLGLVSVFAVLAILILPLKLFQWGELFSKPWFIWSIVTLLVVLAMGLFGSYTVNLPTGAYRFTPRHDTYSGNFFWGALTAILATPCTAPLLPPLLIWAATHPTYVGVPAIMIVGVGMAFPYLLLSAMPELARRLPRTGPWAELFKQMMGCLMLVAAVYFAAGRFISGSGFWWAVVGMVAISCVFLMVRTFQLARSTRPIFISGVLAILLLGGSTAWAARVTGALQDNTSHTWQDFSPEAFDLARAQGKPVLVKFTANWCTSCQYIEGTVFQDENIWKALRSNDVVTLKADMTTSTIAKPLLVTLNPAGGIPLTAIYKPHAKEPIILSSVYTSDTLLKALEQAAKK